MSEMKWYADRIEECMQKMQMLEEKLAKAENPTVQSMIRYEIWSCENDMTTWDEMARERGIYIV